MLDPRSMPRPATFSPAEPPPTTMTSNCSMCSSSVPVSVAGAMARLPRPASENDAMSKLLGIDIGGTGIKGAPVDTDTGQLLADRHRIVTPRPATPEAVAAVVGEVAGFFDWKEATGATFPAVMKNGVACTAANVDPSWIGTDAGKLFSAAIGAPVTVLNDADAAG